MAKNSSMGLALFDLMCCLFGSLMLIVVFTISGNSMPTHNDYPIVNIFIYKNISDTSKGKFYIAMNGNEVTITELIKIIHLTKKEFVIIKGEAKRTIHAVQVIAHIDPELKNGESIKVYNPIMKLNSRKKGKELIVVWIHKNMDKKPNGGPNAQRKKD